MTSRSPARGAAPAPVARAAAPPAGAAPEPRPPAPSSSRGVGRLVCAALVAALAWVFATSDVDPLVRLMRVPQGFYADKAVLVTGASSGIGEFFARDLCVRGAQLVLTARREDKLRQVAEWCVEHGAKHRPLVFPLDMTNTSAHEAFVDEALVATGGRLDVLVLNAGRSQRELAWRTPPAATQALLQLNTVAAASLARAALPHMMRQGRPDLPLPGASAARAGSADSAAGSDYAELPLLAADVERVVAVERAVSAKQHAPLVREPRPSRVVVVSSIAGKIANPIGSSYSASKFALHGFFDALRAEVENDFGVGVTMVCPGPVRSEISVHSFRASDSGEHGGDTNEEEAKKMPTERCAELMAVATANGVDEVWISDQPYLGFTYLATNLPVVWRKLMRLLGAARVRAFLSGVHVYDMGRIVRNAFFK